MTTLTHSTLPNGLTVLLREAHSAPVISFWLAYRVGSRNEPTGQTGISHWVEHMMFKGTEQFPAGMLDREIDRAGGQWNAFTSMDATKYFETLPADKIDIAMRAEADRMVNAEFDAEETESERTVIISERQGAENQPTFWLQEGVRGSAFRVHGYHHEIIGDETDLRRMTRAELYAHYRRHYCPSNAAVIAVGAFDTDDMLARIHKLYGSIPSADVPDLFVRQEPGAARRAPHFGGAAGQDRLPGGLPPYTRRGARRLDEDQGAGRHSERFKRRVRQQNQPTVSGAGQD